MIWPRAAKKIEKWYRRVIEAADCFMARWYEDGAQRSRLRHTAEDTKNGYKGGGGRGKGIRTDTAVDEWRNEMIDRVARYRFDQLLQYFACTSLSFELLHPRSRYLSFL